MDHTLSWEVAGMKALTQCCGQSRGNAGNLAGFQNVDSHDPGYLEGTRLIVYLSIIRVPWQEHRSWKAMRRRFSQVNGIGHW